MASEYAVAAGDIVNIGQVLDASQAYELGQTVLRIHREDPVHSADQGAIRFLPVPTDAPLTYADGRRLYLNPADQELVAGVTETFKKHVIDTVDRKPKIRYDFTIGTPGTKWHVDDGDIRMLVNLSDSDLELGIADEWSPDNFSTRLGYISRMLATPPSASHTLEYTTGEGVVLNGMRKPMDCRPHIGIAAPDKALLRIFGKFA